MKNSAAFILGIILMVILTLKNNQTPTKENPVEFVTVYVADTVYATVYDTIPCPPISVESSNKHIATLELDPDTEPFMQTLELDPDIQPYVQNLDLMEGEFIQDEDVGFMQSALLVAELKDSLDLVNARLENTKDMLDIYTEAHDKLQTKYVNHIVEDSEVLNSPELPKPNLNAAMLGYGVNGEVSLGYLRQGLKFGIYAKGTYYSHSSFTPPNTRFSVEGGLIVKF